MTEVDLLVKPNNPNSTAYCPAEVEAKWTHYWFEQEVFGLDIQPDKPRFSCALPPPNITGSLHMGHALNGTLQDILVRLKRMQGYSVLWQPGTDHAGLAAQMVVERKLAREGKSRHKLGREQFLAEVWEWRNQYGNQIMNQYKRLGVSFNWDRVVFTMDAPYVKAIYKTFVLLYNEGLIYRGMRVANWCPRCQTSLSDLEVQHQEEHGKLFCIKYLLEGRNGDEDSITVATTRPESLFGDVAVAVHPADERYQKFIGGRVILPLVQRKIPIIGDAYVDREFGTGALKITPGHDVNDWEVSQRHGLPALTVIDGEGKLSHNEFVPRKYRGMERFAARETIVQDLEAQGLLTGERDHAHGVGLCDRCQTVIEPQLSEQWYLRMEELAKPAIKAVEQGEITFIPERYTATYLDWMRNIRDWNISRQVWWGHRIPVWTCLGCGAVAAFEVPPLSCTKCGSKSLEQDPDVLDTWFSSALWPFATLGWPDSTLEMRVFYPTTVLSTARDIINLWVSRMIFMSLKLLDKIPFQQVLIHPVVQTPDGKRMSKSKGNAVDPLLMVDKYGADANRFWFASLGIKGEQDVRFREQKLEEYKHFVNKLWNAGNYVLNQQSGVLPADLDLKREKLTLADRWILHRYNSLLKILDESYASYDFHVVAKELYVFTWDYFCAWYLEIAKVQMQQNSQIKTDQTKTVLLTVFNGLLRVLHPIMPFITEELWSRTPKSPLYAKLQSIMFAPYPCFNQNFEDSQADSEMDLIIRIIRSIRNIRQTYNISPSSECTVIISSKEEDAVLTQGKQYIEKLSRSVIDINSCDKIAATTKHIARDKVFDVGIQIPLDRLIDVPKAKEKLTKQKQSIEKDLTRAEQIFHQEDFRAKAPPDKVETARVQLEDLHNQIEHIQEQLKVLAE